MNAEQKAIFAEAERLKDLGVATIATDITKRPHDSFPFSKVADGQRGANFKGDFKGFAVLTGSKSNITVLDIDIMEHLPLLTDAFPEVDWGGIVCVRTRGGGLHYYFQYEPNIANKSDIGVMYDVKGDRDYVRLRKTGFDVRNDNGYAVGPPSYSEKKGVGGYYEWVRELDQYRKPAKMPDRLRQFLTGEAFMRFETKDGVKKHLDMRLTPKEKPKPKKPKKDYGTNVGKTKDLLKLVSSQTYTEWRDVGMSLKLEALKTGEDDVYFDLFDEWSAGQPNYAGEADCRRFWDSFRRNEDDKVISVGTLAHMAQEQNPQQYNQIMKGQGDGNLEDVNAIVLEYMERKTKEVKEEKPKKKPDETPQTGPTIEIAGVKYTKDEIEKYKKKRGGLAKEDLMKAYEALYNENALVKTLCACKNPKEIRRVFLAMIQKIAKLTEDTYGYFWNDKKTIWEYQGWDCMISLISDMLSDLIDDLPFEFKDLGVHFSNEATTKWLIRNGVIAGMKPYLKTKFEANSNKDCLPIPAGCVNLKTGEVRPRTPEDTFTTVLPYNYEPESKSEFVRDFFTKISAGDADMVEFHQRFIGYCLSGHNYVKMLPILIGELGNNGKSVLIRLIGKIMGEFHQTANKRLVLSKRNEAVHDADLDAVKTGRAVFTNELNSSEQFNMELLKAWSGGDPIRIRKCGSNESPTIKPQGKLIMITNNVPKFEADKAFMDRILYVPFDAQFTTDHNKVNPNRHIYPADEEIDRKIEDHLNEFFSWFVEGAMKFFAEEGGGLCVPERAKQQKIEKLKEVDTMNHWFNKCVVADEKGEIFYSDAIKSYFDFCELESLTPIATADSQTVPRELTKIVDRQNLKRGRKRNPGVDQRREQFIIGVRFIPEDE